MEEELRGNLIRRTSKNKEILSKLKEGCPKIGKYLPHLKVGEQGILMKCNPPLPKWLGDTHPSVIEVL